MSKWRQTRVIQISTSHSDEKLAGFLGCARAFCRVWQRCCKLAWRGVAQCRPPLLCKHDIRAQQRTHMCLTCCLLSTLQLSTMLQVYVQFQHRRFGGYFGALTSCCITLLLWDSSTRPIALHFLRTHHLSEVTCHYAVLMCDVCPTWCVCECACACASVILPWVSSFALA